MHEISARQIRLEFTRNLFIISSIIFWIKMDSNDITDIELNNCSKGVDEEIHYSNKCSPIMQTRIFTRRGGSICSVVVFFRNCHCEKYDANECSRLLEQSTIQLPTDGLDIHRDGAGCYYAENTEIDSRPRRIYIYRCQCFCKYSSRTCHSRR